MSGLTVDPKGAIKKLNAEKDRRAYALEVLGRTEAARMQAEARTAPPGKVRQPYYQGGHPWQNITYMAERSITGRAERRGDLTRISLSGGVRYMVYLELAMEKRWAVLWPTIKRHTPEILKAVAKLGGGRG